MKHFLTAVLAALALTFLPSPAAAAPPHLYAVTSCTTASTFDATFSWASVSRDATQVQLQLSYFENGWRPNTYQTSGWLTPDRTGITWPGLPTGKTYFFGLQSALKDGTFELTPTYYVEAPICATPGQPATITTPDSPIPVVDCARQQCLVDEATGLITVPGGSIPQVTSAGGAVCFVPYVGNGRGPTVCEDGCISRSAGSGTCSSHGGIKKP